MSRCRRASRHASNATDSKETDFCRVVDLGRCREPETAMNRSRSNPILARELGGDGLFSPHLTNRAHRAIETAVDWAAELVRARFSRLTGAAA